MNEMPSAARGHALRRAPLLGAQRSFWASRRLHPDEPLDHRVLKARWRIALDAPAFARAFAALVARTDALRLVFAEIDGEALQMELPEADAAFEIRDFRDAADPAAEAEAWLDAESLRPLDLTRRGFAAALARVGEADWIWMLVQHHIATDHTSAALHVAHLSDLYDAALRGEDLQGPPFPAFLDWAEAETASRPAAMQAAAGAAPRRPWRVPSGGGALGAGDTRMLRHELLLGPERLGRAMQALGLAADARGVRARQALFPLAVAATSGLAIRVTGESAPVIGAAWHNRRAPGAGAVAGPLLRMLPLVVSPGDSPRLRDLLDAARTARRDTYAAAAAGRPLPARRYAVALNHIVEGMPPFHGVATEDLTALRADHAAGLDMRFTLRAGDVPGDVKVIVDVNAEIAATTPPASAAAQWLRMFDALVEAPETPLDVVDLAGPEGRAGAEARSAAAHAQPAPDPASVPEAFARSAAAAPEAPALAEGGRVWTYARLDALTTRLAAALKRRGAGPGAIVAVAAPRSAEQILALLGVLRSGAAFCGMDLQQPQARNRSILAECRPLLTLGRGAAAAGFAPEALDVMELAQEPLGDASPIAPPAATDPAYVSFTSGSTGTPKGIVVPHEAFARYTLWLADHLGGGRPFSWGYANSLAFDGALRLFAPFCCGGTLNVHDDSGGAGHAILAALEDDSSDAMMATPSLLRALLPRIGPAHRLKRLLVAGELLTPELARALHERLGGGVIVENCYGPAETTGASAFGAFDPGARHGRSVPVGRPVGGAALHVLDDAMNPVPKGVAGEIWIGGAKVSDGYLGRDDLTAAVFRADPFRPGGRIYRSGDMGWIDGNGNLVITGRADDQIKTGGMRIELGEIDAAILSHPEVTAAAAFLTAGDPPQLHAAYSSVRPLPQADLRAAVLGRLPPAATPVGWSRLEVMPMTATGKIDRRAAAAAAPNARGPAALAAAAAERAEARDADATAETRVAALWADVLGEAPDDREADFSLSGGDSLALVRLALEAESRFGARLPADVIDAGLSIASMTRWAEGLAPGGPGGGGGARAPALPADPAGIPEAVRHAMEVAMAGWPGEDQGRALPMRLINAGGARLPLFWWFNHAPEAAALGDALGADQPIYAFRSLNGLVGTADEKAELRPALAAIAAREIEALAPGGRLAVGGNCQAGRLAAATGRMLAATGRPPVLLCLLESVLETPYPGRAAHFFGRVSAYNPFLRFADPENAWRRRCAEFSWDVIDGDHGEYFREPHLSSFVDALTARLSEAAQRPDWPLPQEAAAASISGAAPDGPLAPGERFEAVVEVVNRGAAAWAPGAASGLTLGARWRDAAGRRRPDTAVPLPAALAPGAAQTIALTLTAPPESGRHVVEIDVCEQGVAWFAELGGEVLTLEIDVREGTVPSSASAEARADGARPSTEDAETLRVWAREQAAPKLAALAEAELARGNLAEARRAALAALELNPVSLPAQRMAQTAAEMLGVRADAAAPLRASVKPRDRLATLPGPLRRGLRAMLRRMR